jgi:hypothetical protein
MMHGSAKLAASPLRQQPVLLGLYQTLDRFQRKSSESHQDLMPQNAIRTPHFNSPTQFP